MLAGCVSLLETFAVSFSPSSPPWPTNCWSRQTFDLIWGGKGLKRRSNNFKNQDCFNLSFVIIKSGVCCIMSDVALEELCQVWKNGSADVIIIPLTWAWTLPVFGSSWVEQQGDCHMATVHWIRNVEPVHVVFESLLCTVDKTEKNVRHYRHIIYGHCKT